MKMRFLVFVFLYASLAFSSHITLSEEKVDSLSSQVTLEEILDSFSNHVTLAERMDSLSNQVTFEEIVDSLSGHKSLSEENLKNKWVNALSNYVFDISTCHCEGNDGCTRGCRRPDQISEEEMPQVRSCYGKKNSSHSTDYCARYVKASIMNVIDDFLSPYCEKHSSYKPYDQCVEAFNLDITGGLIDICQHSFVFHSALCMLNLDGKDASVYDNISNREVRRNCKFWDDYNQMLYSFSFPVLEIYDIPLFKKINTEKYAEFQQDPSQIPTGAIIVSQSQSPHGHVEVKTNQLSCGKDKNAVCFCSDFCLERKKYEEPLKILAVYEWNTQFLEYFEQLSLF